MQVAKYYDHASNRPLDLELDGCDLADWGQLYGRARFARHPKGFRIFLSPQTIAASDEYADSDPYTVEQNIESDFHRKRIEHTADLLHEAVSLSDGIPRVLDLGCGQGHITQEIFQAIKPAEVSGLDHPVAAIEYAYDHFPDIDFSVGDAYAPPYAKAYFDVVVRNNLWEHVPDPLFLLSRIKGLFKPGGYIIVSTPSRYRVINLVRILRGKPVAFMAAHHVTEYTVGQVIEQLAYGGFDAQRVLSRPISMGGLKGRLARRLLAMLVSAVGSHHQLEATVFYLARRSSTSGG